MEGRRLTKEEIERFASYKGVKRIAVENFLMTLNTENEFANHYNAENDSRMYKWKPETLKAIKDGVKLAFGILRE